jgi:hypothetical protein
MKIIWDKKLSEDTPKRWHNTLILNGEGDLTLQRKFNPARSCIEIPNSDHPFILYITYLEKN